MIEFYKQLCWELDVEAKTGSRVGILKAFKSTIREIVATKKQKIIIIIDEAHLLRVDIFAELHTTTILKQGVAVAGVKKQLFSDQAITAIYQGSAGILRKSNLLARGGLVAAAMEKEQVVSAEHIRLASTELL